MAFPVLITVAGLGVGWVALSRARATAPTTPTDGQPGVAKTAAAMAASVRAPGVHLATDAPTAAGVEGGSLPLDSDGNGITIAPQLSTGADPSTSPPEGPGHTTADAQPHAPPSQPGQEFGGDDGGRNLVTARYGEDHQLTRYQKSRALSELGPAAGLVW